MDCRPSCKVAIRSDWWVRTSLTAILMALLTRNTKMASSGVTASAMRAKSQRSQNITTTIPTIVKLSVKMLRVDVEEQDFVGFFFFLRGVGVCGVRLCARGC